MFLDAGQLSFLTREWVCKLPMSSDPVDLNRAVLTVVDMQQDFLLPEGLLPVWGGPAIIPAVRRLIEAFREAERPIVYTRHIYKDPETDGGATARWWKAGRESLLLRDGTWHADLHPEIVPGSEEKVIAKRRYSAFFGTDLDLLLRAWNIRDVVVCGVCTNICCEATAHDAFFRDYNVWMPVDANGGTSEAAHLASLENLALSYAKLITTETLGVFPAGVRS